VITARAAASFDPVGRSVATARAFVRDTLQGGASPTSSTTPSSSPANSSPMPWFTPAPPRMSCACAPRTAYGSRSPTATRSARFRSRARPPSTWAAPTARAAAASSSAPPSPPAGASSTRRRKQVWFQLDLPSARSAPVPPAPSSLTDLLPARRRTRPGRGRPDRPHRRHRRLERGRGGPLRVRRRAGRRQTPHRLRGLAAHARHQHRHRRGPPALPLGGQLRHPRPPTAASRPSTPPTCASATPTANRPRSACWYATTSAPSSRPRCAPPPPSGTGSESQASDPFEVFIGSPAPDDLDGLLQRTVERARDMLDGDSAFLLLATDDETELEVRASTGLPSARQRFARVPVEAGTGRYGSARMPAVHEDLTVVPGAVPLLNGTGMRSGRHGPAQGRGPPHRLLGVAAEARALLERGGAAPPVRRRPHRPGRRVGPPRRAGALRRGSLSFLVEASDLLAGTLDRDQTLALMAQMTVPTLATWCAVYTIADQSSDPVPLLRPARGRGAHRRPQGPALQDRPAGPRPTPGARVWAPRGGRPPGRPAHLHAQPRPRRALHR
jgi:hypothetical protein